MKISEKIYVGVSVLMALATISLLAQEPLFSFIWGEENRHFPRLLLIGFIVLSLILGTGGIIFIYDGIHQKENIRIRLIATLLIIGFYFGAALKMDFNPFKVFFKLIAGAFLTFFGGIL